MANTAPFVEVGVTGSVSVAATGTALPTSPSTTPNAAFKEVGYLSEDGVVQTIAEDSTEIKAWQNADIVRRVQTGHSAQFKLTMIETSAVSLEAYYGTANWTAGVAKIKAGQMPHKSWIIDVADDTDKIRIVIPDGQIVEHGDVNYKNGEAIAYPITIQCYADGTGVKAYVYLATDATSA